MAQTKQTAHQVQLNLGIVKQIDAKHDELWERYLGDTSIWFYGEAYGPYKDNVDSYPSLNTDSEADEGEEREAESANENSLSINEEGATKDSDKESLRIQRARCKALVEEPYKLSKVEKKRRITIKR